MTLHKHCDKHIPEYFWDFNSPSDDPGNTITVFNVESSPYDEEEVIYRLHFLQLYRVAST
jgi:hypothetical protein